MIESDPTENKPTEEFEKEVTLRLKRGQVVRIGTVSPDPEDEILLVVDERDGSLKTSRNPVGFPVQIDLENRKGRKTVSPETPAENRISVDQVLRAFWPTDVRNWKLTDPKTLFYLSLLIYFAIRVVGLSGFPIFFFSDEAMPVIRAQAFWNNRFRSFDGVFFPTFFKNTFQYSLGTTVYMQLFGYILFGKSIFVARLLSLLSTLPAAAGMGLIFKQVFKAKYWWVGTLLFSLVPAWFLHSRTAFETVTAVSLYTLFIYFYFCYRQSESPRQLYFALISGALCFYAYNPARVVIVLSGLLLFLSDSRFHWKQKQVSLQGLLLLVLLVLPYIRHQRLYPQSIAEHLYGLGSYWIRDTTLTVKLGIYLREYVWGLNPLYWYLPKEYELVRHHMLGYGHLSRFMLPFAFWGLGLSVFNFRQSRYRNLILLLLAAPSGAAFADIYITRALFFIVPATLITAIGLLDLVDRLEAADWLKSVFSGWVDSRRLVLLLFFGFAFLNVRMAADALLNGPLWYDIYGLGGLQYGAKQVFGKTDALLQANPGRQIYISNTWTNGTDTVARFFFEEPLPFRLINIEQAHLKERWPMTADTLFILPHEEYGMMLRSDKFTHIQVEDTILWPNGAVGFYLVTADYVPNVDEIFAAELAERLKPITIPLIVSGQPAIVTYPKMDIGDIQQLFDGDELTVARTDKGNPATIIIEFETPLTASGVQFNFGDRAADITATLQSADGETYQNNGSFKGVVGDSLGIIPFDQSYPIETLTLLIQDPQQGELGHVHLWEIEFITE